MPILICADRHHSALGIAHPKTLLGLTLCFTLLGCKFGHEHGHSHGHEHEIPSYQVTRWTNGFEVFAEYQAPAAGKPFKLITHVTDLRTMKARTSGPIQTRLRLDSSPPIEETHPSPVRPGIYLPEITLPRAGSWAAEVIIDGAVIDLGAMTVHATEHDAAHAEAPEEAEGVSFLKEQQWLIEFRTELVQKGRVVEELALAGTVMTPLGGLASIVSPVPGRFVPAPEQPPMIPGRQVQAGELLGLIEPVFSEQTVKFVEAEAEAIRAKAALDQAKLAFERIQRLAAENAKPQRELQEAQFALQAAEAAFLAATAIQNTYKQFAGAQKKPGGFLELRAPAGGIISSLAADLAIPVQAGTPLLTIQTTAKVWVEALLLESRWARLPPKPSARIESAGAVPLAFVYAGAQVDPATRAIPLVYETDNRAGQLRIGQSVPLRVETSRMENGLVIPIGAVVEEEGNPVAYIQLSGETFARRQLQLGIQGGGSVSVIQGLQEGDRVVVKGAYAIRLASASSAIPAHGHPH